VDEVGKPFIFSKQANPTIAEQLLLPRKPAAHLRPSMAIASRTSAGPPAPRWTTFKASAPIRNLLLRAKHLFAAASAGRAAPHVKPRELGGPREPPR
jgi:hypothetical protein